MREDVGAPPPELTEVMGKELQELMRAGRIVDAGGLLPSASATRVRISGGDLIVSDGPFTEATELVGGYAILQVATREEAVEMATRVIQIHRDYWPGWVGECELRQIADVEGSVPGR
jgi:hypothetical protein